jgi:anti-sigma B factor antagonist
VSTNGDEPIRIEAPDALRIGFGALGEQLPVLFVEGELDLAGVEAVEGALGDAAAQGAAVIVDLSACSFIDSSGIATLLRAAGRGNGRARLSLALSGARGQVQRTLELTEVARIVPLFPTPEDAARALGAD